MGPVNISFFHTLQKKLQKKKQNLQYFSRECGVEAYIILNPPKKQSV